MKNGFLIAEPPRDQTILFAMTKPCEKPMAIVQNHIHNRHERKWRKFQNVTNFILPQPSRRLLRDFWSNKPSGTLTHTARVCFNINSFCVFFWSFLWVSFILLPILLASSDFSIDFHKRFDTINTHGFLFFGKKLTDSMNEENGPQINCIETWCFQWQISYDYKLFGTKTQKTLQFELALEPRIFETLFIFRPAVYFESEQNCAKFNFKRKINIVVSTDNTCWLQPMEKRQKLQMHALFAQVHNTVHGRTRLSATLSNDIVHVVFAPYFKLKLSFNRQIYQFRNDHGFDFIRGICSIPWHSHQMYWI